MTNIEDKDEDMERNQEKVWLFARNYGKTEKSRRALEEYKAKMHEQAFNRPNTAKLQRKAYEISLKLAENAVKSPKNPRTEVEINTDSMILSKDNSTKSTDPNQAFLCKKSPYNGCWTPEEYQKRTKEIIDAYEEDNGGIDDIFLDDQDPEGN